MGRRMTPAVVSETFRRLSQPRDRYAKYCVGDTIDKAKTAVAKALGEMGHNVDVVENGGIVDGSRLVKDVGRPLQVVVHNTNRQLPEYRQTTEQDMMNPWEDEPRCRMSCGHAITPDNLYGYCWSELTNQSTSFRCFGDVPSGRCNWEWLFLEVAEKACLSKDEHILFESRINRNWVNLTAGVRECPFCRCVCERQAPNNPCVLCVYCRDAGKSKFEFCWYCLYPWRNNHSCSKDSARHILSSCAKKVIVGVPECPSIRACPTCHTLIEHLEACKHMDCLNCKTKFCFICLDVRGDNGFKCGSYNTKCSVAPVHDVT